MGRGFFGSSHDTICELLDLMADAVLLADSHGIILLANRQTEALFGYAARELLGHPVELLVPGRLRKAHVRQRQEYVSEPAPRLMGVSRSLRARRKDGSELAVDVSLSPIERDGLRMTLALVRDVSERFRLEHELMQAQKLEAIGRLAGGVAHDYNNILTVILGIASGLLEEPYGLNAPQVVREDIEAICKASERASRLTAQLLTFARKQRISAQPTDLNRVVSELEPMLRRLLGKGIELRMKLTAALGSVTIDATQMEQVLVNLAVNAADAMPNGGTLTIETAEAALDASGDASDPQTSAARDVVITVSDTGHGMDAETQTRAFEPFFTTKGNSGTGIGLATVYGIVKQSGGHIRIESEVGKGSVFRVCLPRSADQAPTTTVKAPPDELAIGGSETLLVVEDEALVARAIVAALGKLGYHVLVAQSGLDALRLYEHSDVAIDLLLTDVVMPGLSGRELAVRMGQARASLRVLFMSGYADGTFAEHGPLEPGIQFIEKPFTPRSLALRIREVLDAPLPR